MLNWTKKSKNLDKTVYPSFNLNCFQQNIFANKAAYFIASTLSSYLAHPELLSERWNPNYSPPHTSTLPHPPPPSTVSPDDWCLVQNWNINIQFQIKFDRWWPHSSSAGFDGKYWVFTWNYQIKMDNEQSLFCLKLGQNITWYWLFPGPCPPCTMIFLV